MKSILEKLHFHHLLAVALLLALPVILLLTKQQQVFNSHAAGAPVAVEAENGTVTTGATIITDTTASGQRAIQFAAAILSPTGTTNPTSTPGTRNCPPLPAHPDANCTGVTPGITLTNASTMEVTQDGAVIENLNFTGRLTITGNNVIIRNIKLTTSDYYGVMVYGSNLTIEDSTLIGSSNTQAPLAAINNGSFHALRVNVSGAGDGVSIGNDSSLTDSYVHDLDNSPGQHNDGINADGRQRSSIIHNTILNSNSQTSAVTIGNTNDPSDLLVKDNLLAGGGYTVYAGLGAGAGHGIIFQNNIFSRQYFPNSGYYGTVAYWQSGNGNVWSGNTFDNGEAVNP
jgi:hypothetical protein